MIAKNQTVYEKPRKISDLPSIFPKQYNKISS
jgi:hypothetical protein